MKLKICKGDVYMRANSSNDFKKVLKNSIDIAKDLCYDNSVIDKLKSATSEAEIEIIMNGARRRWD